MSACIRGLGFRFEGFGLRVWSRAECRPAFGVWGLGFQELRKLCRVWSFQVWSPYHRLRRRPRKTFRRWLHHRFQEPRFRSSCQIYSFRGPGSRFRHSLVESVVWCRPTDFRVWECCAPRRYNTNSAEFHTNTSSGRCQHPLPVPCLLPSPTTHVCAYETSRR